MPETLLCCLFLLAALFGVLSSGTSVIKKYGCREESIKLFQNISFPNNNTIVSLHKNGDVNMMIAEWQNNLFNPINGYRGKLYLDIYGNMWLLNLRESDDATYKVKMGLEANATINQVELVVMAAPTKKCKPEIVRVDNSLVASVDQTECGKPPASVHWIEHSAFLVSPQVITLQPEQSNCAYHACIKSVALRCVDAFNLADYCTVFKWNTSNVPSTQSGYDIMSDESKKTVALLVTVLILLILLIGFLVFWALWKFNILFRRNETRKHLNISTGLSEQTTEEKIQESEVTIPLMEPRRDISTESTETNPSVHQVSSSLQEAKESKEETEQNETGEQEVPSIRLQQSIN